MEKGGRLKLRIYRVISTTLQSCRSKDASSLPAVPVPSKTPKARPKPPDHEFSWQKDENWHVVAKIYNSSASDNDSAAAESPPSPPPRRHAKSKKTKRNRIRNRISFSSADSGWFSSDAADESAAAQETETLVSSSISSSSDLLPPIRESQKLNRRRSGQRRRKGVLPAPPPAAAAEEAPARLSVFQKMIPCAVEGKVKESFAIVKRSNDPYEDFKRSMMDMVVEKQMFEAEDLEQLLQCFLSLNSRHYHGVIVQAFTEIWEAIFCHSSAGH